MEERVILCSFSVPPALLYLVPVYCTIIGSDGTLVDIKAAVHY